MFDEHSLAPVTTGWSNWGKGDVEKVCNHFSRLAENALSRMHLPVKVPSKCIERNVRF